MRHEKEYKINHQQRLRLLDWESVSSVPVLIIFNHSVLGMEQDLQARLRTVMKQIKSAI